MVSIAQIGLFIYPNILLDSISIVQTSNKLIYIKSSSDVAVYSVLNVMAGVSILPGDVGHSSLTIV